MHDCAPESQALLSLAPVLFGLFIADLLLDY